MFKRNKLLFLLVLPLLISSIFWGCSQPEDVLTPLTKTDIWLNPTKLPSNPDGMVYELWVANSTDTLPLAKFGYNFELGRFLEPGGEPRADSNQFFLGYDLMDFTNVFVSIETYPDDNTNSPGPIMLMDMTSNPTIKLRFPKMDELWASTVWYNMESASDGQDSVTDGYSVWFSTYSQESTDLNDTLGVSVIIIDLGSDTTKVPGVDTLIVETGITDIIIKDTARIFGLDILVNKVVRFTVLKDTIVDTPFTDQRMNLVYDIFEGTVSYDNFHQGNDNEEFGMPVLSEYGWKYKGWVASPQIDSTAVTARITLPAWITLGSPFEETEGGILTVGAFADVRAADESNPYVVSGRVPPYPGEDFLANLPGGLDPICLVPNANAAVGNPGRVFISLEPDNYTCDSTNFPLIPYIRELPASREMVTSSDDIQMFIMWGWMQDTSDPYRGFPWIGMEFERR